MFSSFDVFGKQLAAKARDRSTCGAKRCLANGSIPLVALCRWLVAAKMKTTITLADMQDKGMRMLVVACRRCERRGRLSIASLIAEHGRDDGGRVAQLIAQLPKDAEPDRRPANEDLPDHIKADFNEASTVLCRPVPPLRSFGCDPKTV
jgi:hypothetical protein